MLVLKHHHGLECFIIFSFIFLFYGLKHSIHFLLKIEVIRVVVPPVVLIIAVLGSIFGGVTNPTPAAALGAGEHYCLQQLNSQF